MHSIKLLKICMNHVLKIGPSLNVTKAYNAYYNVPSGCITDNKGENLDTLAGAFLARAAIVDWGLSFIYVEIAFLLLTVFHAFYCTGTGKPDDANRKASDVEMLQNGAAKQNPFGPGINLSLSL